MVSPTPIGTFRSGTSGFAYASWAPRFYAADVRAQARLAAYASRLAACELNNTFYQRPSRERLRSWRAAVGPGFRFVIKAQRGAALRAMRGDPVASIAWLTEHLDELGPALGAMILRVPAGVPRVDAELRALLAAWPVSIPLVVELQEPSWHVDETFSALRDANAVLCATDLDGGPPPDLRVTGPFVYIRLRRTSYAAADLTAWAERLAPFIANGLDAYAFLRHDEDGGSALAAESLARAVADRLAHEQGA